MNLENIIKPETELEKTIIGNEEFRTGCLYGKPRSGHPEGQIIFHIREVLANVEKYSTKNDREKLRVISLIHDTFKYKVNQNIPKIEENNHGMIARRFIEKYTQNQEILEITELHDEAFNSWKFGERKNNWNSAVQRAEKLIARLDNSLCLYLMFYKCDNLTGDKSRINYDWFENLARSHL